MIVLISGKMGSGKTTLARRLHEHFTAKGYNAIRTRFAEPLYQMQDKVREVLKDFNYTNYDYETKDGPLLQLLGTEWGRKTVDENIWVDLIKSKYEFEKDLMRSKGLDPDEGLVFLVEDCRFKNELDYFPEAISFRLECSREVRKSRCEMWRDRDTHPSETDLDGYATEGRFTNTINSEYLDLDKVVKLAVHTITDPKIYREKYGIRKISEGLGLSPEPEILASGD